MGTGREPFLFFSVSHAKQKGISNEFGLLEFIHGLLGRRLCRCLYLGFVMKARRSFAGFLAAFVFAFSVIVPFREARAFAPIAVLGAPQIVTAGGAYAVAALSGLIGVVGLYLQISDSEGNETRIPLSTNPVAVPPAPSAPATAVQSPGGSQFVEHGFAYGYEYDSMSACEAASCAMSIAACQGWGNTNCQCSGPYCTAHMVEVVTPPSCPSGYTVTGSGCVLSEPRRATPDKKCDLQFNSNKYLYYDDADCPNGPSIDHSKSVPGLRMDGRLAYVYGKNSYGDPILAQVLIQTASDGTVTQVVLDTYRVVGANVQHDSATINSTGQVTSATSSLAPGTITSPVSSPTTTSTPGTSTDTPTVTTDPTKSPVVQFPDDYSREVTLQRNVTNTGKIADALTTPATGVVDPSLPGQSDFGDHFFQSTFTNLLGWRLPAHTSQCPTGSFQAFGETFVMNTHCQMATDHMSALQNAMAVVFVIGALFIVLKA